LSPDRRQEQPSHRTKLCSLSKLWHKGVRTADLGSRFGRGIQ